MLRYLVLILPLLLVGCAHRQLRSGLSEKDAQEIVVLLRDNGLDAYAERETGEKKETPTWEVKVAGGSDRLTAAWRILRENGLPREQAKGLDDVFANAGMIPTASEEKARLLVGLAGELTRTLKSVSGIVDARVQVVLPENSPLLDKSEWSKTTASVLVKFQGGAPPLKEEDIKKLVARGVEGLEPDNVAVVFNRVEVKPPAPYNPWTLGNEQLTAAGLLLACISGFGSLALVGRVRMLNSKVKGLEKELTKARAAQVEGGTAKQVAGGAGKN
jgi:type III secretion protein J